MFPLGIDCGDHVRQSHVAASGDVLQPSPEGILKADARLVSGDDHGVLDDRRFHPSSFIWSLQRAAAALMPLTMRESSLAWPIHQ